MSWLRRIENLEVVSMDKQERVRRMEQVAEELDSLEGVREAILDNYAPSTASSGQVAVMLEVNDSWHNRSDGQCYKLDANLRSLAQRIRGVLGRCELVNSTVYHKPERVYNAVGDGIGHDDEMYVIEVIP